MSRVTGRHFVEGELVSTGTRLFRGSQTGRQGAGAGFTARIQGRRFAITNVLAATSRARGDDWEVLQFALMPAPPGPRSVA
jgi:hypothetical protein